LRQSHVDAVSNPGGKHAAKPGNNDGELHPNGGSPSLVTQGGSHFFPEENEEEDFDHDGFGLIRR
jgi:hypothetical protein